MIRIRFSYSYKEYKDYPEATEISKTRGILFTFYCIVLGFGVLSSIALLSIETWYEGIIGLILCIAGFVYLVTRYETVTERKIACAIFKRQLEKEMCISDSSTIRKLMKEFKKELKQKEHNDVPYDKMI